MEKVFLRRLLELRNSMSYKAFADKTGLDKTSLERWEKGTSDIKSDAIVKLCSACGVSADWLLGLSDNRTPAAPGFPASGLKAADKHESYKPCPSCVEKDRRIVMLEETVHNLSVGRTTEHRNSVSGAARY